MLQLLCFNSHLNPRAMLLAVLEAKQAPDEAQAFSGSLLVGGCQGLTEQNPVSKPVFMMARVRFKHKRGQVPQWLSLVVIQR